MLGAWDAMDYMRGECTGGVIYINTGSEVPRATGPTTYMALVTISIVVAVP